MKNLICLFCDPDPRPSPGPGVKAERLTAIQRNVLIAWAGKNAPGFIQTLRRAEFYKIADEWYHLLDGDQEHLEVLIHKSLWIWLFG